MGSTAKWDAGLYDEKHSFVWKMAAGLVELLQPKPGEQVFVELKNVKIFSDDYSI